MAVDREEFAKRATEEIEKNPNIEIIRKEVSHINNDEITVIATGPLTSDKMAEEIAKLIGENKLYFYDAAAPIIEKDSIDMNIAFFGDRYGKMGDNSYINLPMLKRFKSKKARKISAFQLIMFLAIAPYSSLIMKAIQNKKFN